MVFECWSKGHNLIEEEKTKDMEDDEIKPENDTLLIP